MSSCPCGEQSEMCARSRGLAEWVAEGGAKCDVDPSLTTEVLGVARVDGVGLDTWAMRRGMTQTEPESHRAHEQARRPQPRLRRRHLGTRPRRTAAARSEPVVRPSHAAAPARADASASSSGASSDDRLARVIPVTELDQLRRHLPSGPSRKAPDRSRARAARGPRRSDARAVTAPCHPAKSSSRATATNAGSARWPSGCSSRTGRAPGSEGDPASGPPS